MITTVVLGHELKDKVMHLSETLQILSILSILEF